jgi:hypothetical protein
MADHSALSFSSSLSSGFAGVVSNGTIKKRRRIAASRVLISGAVLPMNINLNVGLNSKESCLINLARIVSPAVSYFTRTSSHT